MVNVNSPEMVIEFLASLCGEIENTPGVEAYLCQLEVPDSDSEDAAPPAKTNGVNGHSKKAEDTFDVSSSDSEGQLVHLDIQALYEIP